jgi:hypothetical protein
MNLGTEERMNEGTEKQETRNKKQETRKVGLYGVRVFYLFWMKLVMVFVNLDIAFFPPN